MNVWNTISKVISISQTQKHILYSGKRFPWMKTVSLIIFLKKKIIKCFKVWIKLWNRRYNVQKRIVIDRCFTLIFISVHFREQLLCFVWKKKKKHSKVTLTDFPFSQMKPMKVFWWFIIRFSKYLYVNLYRNNLKQSSKTKRSSCFAHICVEYSCASTLSREFWDFSDVTIFWATIAQLNCFNRLEISR